MKKFLLIPALAFALYSCKNEVPSAPAEPATNVTVNESPEQTPPPPPPVKTEEDGTDVKVGTDGVSVKTNNGDNKTDVSLEAGKTAVEIKK